MSPHASGPGPLAGRPVPYFLPEQIERFTFVALRAKPVRSFDPQATLDLLRDGGEKSVLAADIGGDKLTSWAYEVRNGHLLQVAEVVATRGDGGAAYLDGLEKVAELARSQMIPVGISFAGPIEGTRLVAGPNLPIFISDLRKRYHGSLVELFPAVALANDAEVGLRASALEAVARRPDTRNVIYVINGSGLGGAILKDNMIFASEPGHIPIDPRLNPFNQSKLCGVLGGHHVCVEAIAASKAGVEDIWFQQRGERLSGKEIAARFLAGDAMALDLYDNSALVTAHAIEGIARAFGLADDLDRTVVVGHGGIFEVPGYRQRLLSILERNLHPVPEMLFTKDFSANACLDGAAIAAALL